MEDKDKRCILCGHTVEKITDKDYPKFDYYFCDNKDCVRCGLLAVIFDKG